jgi:two-component system cell cycle response regulator
MRQPAGGELSWVMIDVDRFKDVNDTYGHTVGDRVLASLAGLLRRRLRRSGQVGRYGGEEFALLVGGLPEPEVVHLVERLLGEFGAMSHRDADGRTFSCTFSAGVAMLQSRMTLEDWKTAADDALYAAKTAGRNRVLPARTRAGGERDDRRRDSRRDDDAPAASPGTA